MTLGKVPDPIFMLRAHTTPVQSCRFVGENDSYILSGSIDGDVCLWNSMTKRIESNIKNIHKRGLLSVDQLNDTQIFSHGRDGMVYIYDIHKGLGFVNSSLETGCFAYTQARPIRQIQGTQFSSCFTASSKEEGNISLYDPISSSSSPVSFLFNKQKEGMVLASQLVESHSSTYHLVSCTDAGNIIIHDVRNPNEYLCSLHISESTLLSFDITSSLNTIICGGSSKQLFKLNIDLTNTSLSLLQTISIQGEGLGTIKIRNDDKIVATGGWDTKIRLFQTKNMNPLAILHDHQSIVTCVDFSKYNDLISGSEDTKILFWNIYK
ncbi:hypothetical protein WA158_007553 [Blastocystis sp. Blastoise]